MRVLASYNTRRDNITVDDTLVNITGEVMFICGRLSMVTDSVLLEYKRRSPMGSYYNVHKVLSFDHITNEGVDCE